VPEPTGSMWFQPIIGSASELRLPVYLSATYRQLACDDATRERSEPTGKLMKFKPLLAKRKTRLAVLARNLQKLQRARVADVGALGYRPDPVKTRSSKGPPTRGPAAFMTLSIRKLGSQVLRVKSGMHVTIVTTQILLRYFATERSQSQSD